MSIASLSASCSAGGDDAERYYAKDYNAERQQLAVGEDFEQYYGKDYIAVRQELVESGYELPKVKHDSLSADCGLNDNCETFPEAQSCSDVGFGFCNFVLRKKDNGRCIIITTFGEDQPMVDEISAATGLDKAKLNLNCT